MKTRMPLLPAFALACVAVAACTASVADEATPPPVDNVAEAGAPDGGGPAPSPDGGAVDATVAPFGTIAIALSAPTLTIKQGRTATFEVTITRPADVIGPVDVDVNGLPPGASAKTVRIASGETKATIEVAAADVTPQGTSTAAVVATSGARSDGIATLAVTVIGRAGTLDTSYGIGGKSIQTIPAFSYGTALAMQPSGASILAVSSQVVRVTAGGKRDSMFGTSGVASIGGNWLKYLGVDAAGRPVLGYRNNFGTPSVSTAGVARFTADGAPDGTFGTSGVVNIAWGSTNPFSDSVESIGLLADGRVVVAGDSNTNAGTRTSIIGLLENGQPDPSFTRFDSPFACFGATLARTPAGDWMVGTKNAFFGNTTGKLFRVTASGALDATFQGGTPLTANVLAMTVLGDGKILYTTGGTIVKLLDTGAPDTSFATGGTYTVPVGGPSITSLAVQSDGAIVAAGGVNNDFASLRLLPNGTLDTEWGDGGVAQTDIASVADGAASVRIQADGKVLVAGTSGGKAAVVRYWP